MARARPRPHRAVLWPSTCRLPDEVKSELVEIAGVSGRQAGDMLAAVERALAKYDELHSIESRPHAGNLRAEIEPIAKHARKLSELLDNLSTPAFAELRQHHPDPQHVGRECFELWTAASIALADLEQANVPRGRSGLHARAGLIRELADTFNRWARPDDDTGKNPGFMPGPSERLRGTDGLRSDFVATVLKAAGIPLPENLDELTRLIERAE